MSQQSKSHAQADDNARFEVLELTDAPTLHVGQSPLRRAVQFGKRYLFAVGASAYLLTIGQASSRNRAFLHVIADFFGYRSPSAAQLPSIGAYDLLASNPDVRLVETAGVNGNVSLMELAVIDGLVRARQPRAIFEIGTFDGRTTYNLAVNGPTDAQLYTLDLPPGSSDSTALKLDPDDLRYIEKPEAGTRFHGTVEAGRIQQLYGDSATFDFGPYRSQIDFVFVDGSHSYHYVMRDSINAYQMLRDARGVILWHDYGTWLGVTQALNELYATDRRFQGLRRISGTALAMLSEG